MMMCHAWTAKNAMLSELHERSLDDRFSREANKLSKPSHEAHIQA